MPNTSSPWSGVVSSANNAKEKPTLMDEMNGKESMSNIVSRVRAALDNSDDLKRADDLKKMIDNPTSCGGREWNPEEKNKLEQAKADYQIIQSEKEHIKKSLNDIGSLFDDKSQQSIKLAEDVRNIKSKLNEIDNHLSEYEDKLKLLGEKGDNISAEERAWEIQARKLMSKLMSERDGLDSSLTKIHSLQTELDDAEEIITKQLEKLLGASPRSEQQSGPQSADSVNIEMGNIKDMILDLGASLRGICTAASQLFANIFSKIKNLSSEIASQFTSVNATLAESATLLSNYPTAGMQARL